MKIMLLFLFLLGMAGAVDAQAPLGADAQLPPALRNRPADASPAAGAALRAQALAKLEAQFRAADLDGNRTLSREEAKGFGFVSRHFDAIETRGSGAVSFDELRAYLEGGQARRR